MCGKVGASGSEVGRGEDAVSDAFRDRSDDYLLATLPPPDSFDPLAIALEALVEAAEAAQESNRQKEPWLLLHDLYRVRRSLDLLSDRLEKMGVSIT